jgi:hypothetical protein
MEFALQVGGLVMRAITLSVECGKGFISGTLTMDDIMSDYKNYSQGNTDLEKVMKAKLFSSYKGILVIKVDTPAAYSYGQTIYINKRNGENIINHEYGHALQEQILGAVGYTFGIAVQSVSYNKVHEKQNLPESIYYSMPWEITADLFGGVKRGQGYYSSGAIERGLEYFLNVYTIVDHFR